MSKMTPTVRQRGIQHVRADAGGAAQILADLQKSFAEFKAEYAEQLKGVNAKFDDVVQREKVDRINAEVGTLNAALSEINASIAALKVGGGGGGDVNPDQRAHAKAFDRFFRKGVEAGLGELEVKAGLTTQSDPNGGYLVPTETAATIDRVLGTTSVMRQLANVMPIGTNTYEKLMNMGGAAGGWVGETGSRPETATPSLRKLLFTVMELYANPPTTQQMLDDGIVDIAAWLADEVNITFTEMEAAAFIGGNGVNEPRGLLSHDTVLNSSYAWGKIGFVKTGAAADFATDPSAADNFIDTYFALKQGYRSNASWLMSDVTMGRVRKFKDSEGNLIWSPPSSTGEVATILGKPVYGDDYMPAVGAGNFPVAFGDFRRGYMILDRQGIRVLRDPFSNKPYVTFYTTKRVGGGVSNFEAIKLLKCAS